MKTLGRIAGRDQVGGVCVDRANANDGVMPLRDVLQQCKVTVHDAGAVPHGLYQRVDRQGEVEVGLCRGTRTGSIDGTRPGGWVRGGNA